MKIRVKGKTKEIFSVRLENGKAYVKFSKQGKEYAYFENNIAIIEDNSTVVEPILYTYKSNCYKCNGEMDILTYLMFFDDSKENLIFPWDKNRLLNHQNLFAHMEDPSIEYYGVYVIGDIDELDEQLIKLYPKNISKRYSSVKKRSYAMNICQHCGAQKGWYYVYRDINEIIKKETPLKIFDTIKN